MRLNPFTISFRADAKTAAQVVALAKAANTSKSEALRQAVAKAARE